MPRLSLETVATGSASTTRGLLTGPNSTSLGLMSGGQTDSFAVDWLGGVADVLAPDGSSVASYDYDPYGNPRDDGTAASGSTVDNPIRFTGGYQDQTLGSRYSFPARTYDPSTGRFGGVDPVAPNRMAPGVSSYAYVGDRPTVFRDPSGARGGNPDHDDAELLALDQLDPKYGASNVYADADPTLPRTPGWPGTTPGGYICVPTASPVPGDPLTSCPDIIARRGTQTHVYEVKPASDQLSPIRPDLPDRGVANASQVARYVRSLANAGYPNVAPGPDIAPDSRTESDGSTLTIFPGADWAQFAPKGKRAAPNPAGIIYYVKTKPRQVPPPAAKPTATPNEEPTEQPTEQPTSQPTTAPIDEPAPSDVGQEVEDVLHDRDRFRRLQLTQPGGGGAA